MKPHIKLDAIKNPTVSDLIERYINDSELPGARPFGVSKKYTLRMLQRMPIGAIVARDLKQMDIVNHCRSRRAAGIHAATVKHDFTEIRITLRTAQELWEIPGVSLEPCAKAVHTLKKEQLIAKSMPRTRRPTPEEMALIMEGAHERMKWRTTKIPLPDIYEMAWITGRRISETCRIMWGDIDHEKRLCYLRDLKNAAGKGFHAWFALRGRSWDIVMAQPRRTDDPKELIFPYNSQSCGAAFRAVCDKKGIKGLRLHDHRRECFSAMFEDGFTVPEVQLQSLHFDAKTLLTNYVSLAPESIHLGPASKRMTQLSAVG